VNIKSVFERACMEPVKWTPELEKLATGYAVMMSEISSAEEPLSAYEAAAIATGLARFASNVGWISERAFEALRDNAKQVRVHTSKQWAGQTVIVTARGRTAASHTKH